MTHMPTVLIGEKSSVELGIVMLHGYAMQPEDLSPFAYSLGVPGRYLFPRGPWPVPGGGFGWWPVDEERRSASLAVGPRDLAGEHPAARAPARSALAGLLKELREGSVQRLVVAGFSQGGMLACDTLLHEEVRVDGLALLSSSRLAIAEWHQQRDRLAGLPVMVAHGSQDTDLAFSAGQALHDWLRDSGACTRWVPFDGGHQIPLPVWREFRKFVRNIAQAKPAHGGTLI